MIQLPRDSMRPLRRSPIFSLYASATLVVAAIVALITVNVIDLGMDHFGDESHRTHDVAFGLIFTTLVVGNLAQLRRPDRNVAAMVTALVPAAALLLAGVLTGQVDRIVQFNPLRSAAALTVVVALLHPAGATFVRSFRIRRVSVPMLAMVGVATIPLVAFAATNLRLQRTVTDAHAAMGHYGFMAALCYTVIGVGLLAALRPVGWRFSAWVAGLIAAVLGATSLVAPDSTSSLATGWAVIAIAWGVTFVAVAMRTIDDRSPATSAACAIDERTSPLDARLP